MSKRLIFTAITLVIILVMIAVYAMNRSSTMMPNVSNTNGTAQEQPQVTSMEADINSIGTTNFDKDFESINADIGGL